MVALPFAYIIGAIVLHESGHALAASALGHRWKLFFRFPVAAGVAVYAPEHGMPAKDDVLIALAGPVVSILIGIAAWKTMPGFSFISFDFGLFSLLPIRPGDGWRIKQHIHPRKG